LIQRRGVVDRLLGRGTSSAERYCARRDDRETEAARQDAEAGSRLLLERLLREARS